MMAQMKDPKFLEKPSVVPVLRFEPPGMFPPGRPLPQDPRELQALFRKAVEGNPLSGVEFVPGSELLIALSSLTQCLDAVAEVCGSGVTTFGGAELLGGYAYLDDGYYLFGVEDDSALSDTRNWEMALEQLEKTKKATIYHACDNFFSARLDGKRIVLTHERSGSQYAVEYRTFQKEVRRASDELREFARKFTPIFARHLSMDRAYEAAYENFKNRPHWFPR